MKSTEESQSRRRPESRAEVITAGFPGLPDPAAPSLTCFAGLTLLRFLITFLPRTTSNAPQFSISGYKVITSPDKTGRDKGLHSSQISRHKGPEDRACWPSSCLTWGRSLEFAKTHFLLPI